MSRLLRSEMAAAAASIGSFVLHRSDSGFRPRLDPGAPSNDFAPSDFAEESEPLRIERRRIAALLLGDIGRVHDEGVVRHPARSISPAVDRTQLPPVAAERTLGSEES